MMGDGETDWVALCYPSRRRIVISKPLGHAGQFPRHAQPREGVTRLPP